MALRIDPQYNKERNKYGDLIRSHKSKIAKTVDLFSRIKDTEQAEEVLTVLFASRQLKRAKRSPEIDEQDIYEFIVSWKKTWSTDEKREAISDAVKNLAVLGWLNVRFNSSSFEGLYC